MTEFTFIKLTSKIAKPDNPGTMEKTSFFASVQNGKRAYRIVREGDTVTITAVDPQRQFRVCEVPWAQVEYAERAPVKNEQKPQGK